MINNAFAKLIGFRSVPLYPARTIDSVVDSVVLLEAATAIIDIEPMVTHWAEPATAFVSRMNAVANQLFSAAPSLKTIIFASNSRRFFHVQPMRDGVSLVVGAQKPWRTSFYGQQARPVIVVGDQVLTDGLLAWRICATFIHWQMLNSAPWWPSFQASLGKCLIPVLFRPSLEGMPHES